MGLFFYKNETYTKNVVSNKRMCCRHRYSLMTLLTNQSTVFLNTLVIGFTLSV